MGLSVFFNGVFLLGSILFISLYKGGFLDFAIINQLLVDKFTAPGSCWTTPARFFPEGQDYGYLDSKGRVAFKDEKGQEKVLCIQNVTPQQADSYQLETGSLNNQQK